MKKIISILLSVSMIACLLCACSNGNAGSEIKLKYSVDSHYSTAEKSAVRAYEKLCAAVENGESEIRLNTSAIESVNQLFYTCFPMYSLVDTIVPTDEKSVYKIKYVNDEEKHLELVAQFRERVNEIMTECGFGKVNTNRYIFNVYTYIAKNFSLDNSAVNTFDTILNGKGYYAAVNSAFEYLVLQGGGRACHIVNYDGSSTIISSAKFNNKWYFFDPAGELSDNSGKALKFFAMSGKDAKAVYSTDKFNYTDGKKIEEMKSEEYAELRKSTSFKEDNSKISVTLSDGKDKFLITFE